MTRRSSEARQSCYYEPFGELENEISKKEKGRMEIKI
jgi:hypothetical protein